MGSRVLFVFRTPSFPRLRWNFPTEGGEGALIPVRYFSNALMVRPSCFDAVVQADRLVKRERGIKR